MAEAFDYVDARNTADELIAEFGQAGAIRKTTAGSGGDPWNPASHTGGSVGDTPCTLVVLDYDASERNGSLIEQGDRRVLIAAGGLAVVPVAGDEVVIAGAAHPIKELSPLNPGGTVVMYEARVGA